MREVIVETDAIAEELKTRRRDGYGEFKYMISLNSVGESNSRPIQQPQITLKLGLVFRVDAASKGRFPFSQGRLGFRRSLENPPSHG